MDANQPFRPLYGVRVHWGRWIGDARRLVFDNLGFFVLATLIEGALSWALKFLLGLVSPTDSPEFGMREVLRAVPYAAITGPLIAGAFVTCLLKAANREARVSDLYSGFRFFWWPTFAATLTISLFTSLPMFIAVLMSRHLSDPVAILSAVPAALIWVLYPFTYLFIVDRRMSFWPAMQSSMAIVSRNYAGFLMFNLALVLVNTLGLICCFVGILVSLPVSMVAVTLAYRDIAGFDVRNLDALS